MDRLAALHAWLRALPAEQCPCAPGEDYTLEPASADASFRRYFRLTLPDGGTRIVMDAPPEHEDCGPFIHVAGLLLDAGIHAPHVLAQDTAQGFLLLTDLGRDTYLKVINPENAHGLFMDAIDTLIRWQLASRPGVLPPYDEALLRREMSLFPEWYVGRHKGLDLRPEQSAALEASFEILVRSALDQPAVFVHRDYMPRNLMISTPNPGVLDFQDAVFGPITYDVASLFRDAFLSWEEEQVIDWTIRYWEKARKAGLPVPTDFSAFYQQFELMGLQRHLKVLGIFARLNYRDGKPDYLADTPRFIQYARSVAQRYIPLTPLARLLDDVEAVAPNVGYTF